LPYLLGHHWPLLCKLLQIHNSLFSLVLWILSPRAITLMHLNSSATILCSTTKQQPIGLYLKRRFSGDRDVLYLRVENGKATINREFTNRVLVQGDCCDYQLQLSSLKVEDTDSYYCKWILMDNDKGDVNYFPSHETVIVVRGKAYSTQYCFLNLVLGIHLSLQIQQCVCVHNYS
uniref:Immunoglobulin V-set domain-containing protein n=1 Tax=Denticeps clupeoides TaxID=299321 RepID=A0AAY3ZWV5_9TELE